MKEADQTIRKQISPPERLQILDEAYCVREEERFLEGTTGMSAALHKYFLSRRNSLAVDGKASVLISRANLPDAMELSGSDRQGDQECAPVIETPSQEHRQRAETVRVRSGTASGCNALQAGLTPRADISVHGSPDLRPIPYYPTWYMEQDPPMHTNHNFDLAAASILQ